MSDSPPNTPRVSFRAFLSHRYKSPEVNEYFFGLFDGIAIPQFQVDKGTFATNMTRLERLIRGSDAFIGFYPLASGAQPTNEQLRKDSRYFRLELDLAERAGKPATHRPAVRAGAGGRAHPRSRHQFRRSAGRLSTVSALSDRLLSLWGGAEGGTGSPD
jgi:hypothetical protein